MHIVIDKDGNPWGPFETATEAAQWAAKKWPDQQQDEDHRGLYGKGWDLVALCSPNDA